MALKIDKRYIGSPGTFLNVPDVIAIGLCAIFFFLILQVGGMAWHRLQLWRFTGSASSVPVDLTTSASSSDAQTTVEST